MKNYVLLICLIAGFLSFSCSNSGITIPEQPQKSEVANQLGLLVSEFNVDGNPISGYGFLGVFSVRIDTVDLTGEMTTLRKISLEDVLEVVDITNFLSMAPCTNCAKLRSIALDTNGDIVLSIGIKHPFTAGDPIKPITGRNRADLHVFNVEGVIITDGSGVKAYPGFGVTTANNFLLNADGATGYLDDSLDNIFPTASDVHPYILHFDDFSEGNYNPANPMGFQSVTTPPPSGHLVMAMGCDYDYKNYIFKIDSLSSFEFQYAIGCTYAVSAASKNQRFNPEYRCPQHNKKAATMMGVDIISNDLMGGDDTSTADFEIRVVDVNHGIPVGSALNEIRADSSISKVEIEIPGITASVVNVPLAPVSGDGLTPATALVYPITISNSAAGDLGVYTGIVKITDSCSTGLNSSPLLNGMDGITRVDPVANPLTGLFQIPEFATYAIFSIAIESHNIDPIAELLPNPVQVAQGGTVAWNATGSTDPDGSIVFYEWDYVLVGGNPVNFNADASGIIGTQVSAPYNVLGNFVAAVRVTDDLGGKDIAVADVEVVEAVPDLVLDAVRNNYTPTSGAELACYITHVHLDWEDISGAAQYAVYRSHLYADPLNWIEIGVTTPPVSQFDDVYLLTYNRVEWMDHKYIYEVRPRTISGNPLSEGNPTQRAYIFMESNDMNPQVPNQRAPFDPEQPNFVWNYGAGGSFNTQYAGAWCSDEPYAYGAYVNIFSLGKPTSSWQVYYPALPLPDIDGQTMAYFDFAFSCGPGGNVAPQVGFATGTFGTPPSGNGLPAFTDFDPAPAADYLLGQQYKSTFDSTSFVNFFGEPAGTTALHSPYYPFRATRYKLTRLLQADIDYPAIGIASWNLIGFPGYHMWDSIAIVVY